MLDIVIVENRGCSRTLAWVLLVLGFFSLGCVMWNQFRLTILGKVTDGVVIKPSDKALLDERIHSRGSSHPIYVRYTPGGRQSVEFKTSSTFGTELNQGDPVKVIYLAQDPLGAEIYSMTQLWLPMMLGLLMSALCLGGGWVLRAIIRTGI